MRIAIVTESFLPRTDGVVRTVIELLRYLRSHDHRALVFAAGPGPDSHAGYPVHRVRGPRCPLYPDLTLAPHAAGMRRTLSEWQPDVIHLASPCVLGAQGRAVGRRLGIPVAAHYQTDIGRYAGHFGLGALAGLLHRHLVRLHNGCDVTYAPTATVARDLRERGMHRVRVLGRGVDADLFRPDRRSTELRRRLLRPHEHTLFLYVGRLSAEKNLEALEPIVSAVPGARLIVVGDGPHRAALERRFAETAATFLGFKHGDELATIYASADVFVFPSLTETFGQVVQEAMAAGLPVLAFGAGGVQDLLRDGVDGYLCPANDRARWVALARRLACDGALRARLGEEARHTVRSRTWDEICGRLLADYRSLAAERCRRAAPSTSLDATTRIQ